MFDAVQAGQAAFGVVPFENSTHGTVTPTLESLADRAGARRDGELAVCGETYLAVHHFLVGRVRPWPADDGPPPGSGACTPTAAQPNPTKPRARPLASLRHVRRVYSHPQGFGQTAVFLNTYLRGVDTVDVSSTSRAAELVAADPTGNSAAISSEMAAERHGLDLLARCIEDRDDNTTRFFILRRGDDNAAATAALPAAAATAGHGAKSLVSFTVPHRSPGALALVLDCFRRSELNLTSINSLPSLIRPFQYLFFAEFEGSLDDPDGRVRRALDGLADVAQTHRWLGSWESQRRS